MKLLRTYKSFLLVLVAVSFASCGGPPTITSPTQGQLIALNGATQATFNVSDSNNSFSNASVSIYSVNPSITGTCAVSTNYAQCTIIKGSIGGSCSTTQPCDALITLSQGNYSQEVLVKVTF
jgi:hypothetical protein